MPCGKKKHSKWHYIQKGKKYLVRAESEGVVRNETINTHTNELFYGCNNEADVKAVYEAFWSLDKYSPKVRVLAVIPLDDKKPIHVSASERAREHRRRKARKR